MLDDNSQAHHSPRTELGPHQTSHLSGFQMWLENEAPVFSEEYFTVYMYQIFSIHLSVAGHLGCFLVLSVVNRPAMNIGMHVFSNHVCLQIYAQE